MTCVGMPVCLGPLVANVVAESTVLDRLPQRWAYEGQEPTWSIMLGIRRRTVSNPSPMPAMWANGRYHIVTPFVEGWISPERAVADLMLKVGSHDEVDLGRKILSALRLCCLLWLAEHDGVGLHGASVVQSGKAVGFLGKSGTGKTTIVTRFPTPVVLGDDFLAVQWVHDRFFVYGTPFSGREGHAAQNRVASLRALAILHPCTTTHIEPIPASERVAALARHTFLVTDRPEARRKTLGTVAKLAEHTAMYRLHRTISDSPWSLGELIHG